MRKRRVFKLGDGQKLTTEVNGVEFNGSIEDTEINLIAFDCPFSGLEYG
jgi:hypothetical protein